jgi:hypothetical protein
MKNRVKFVAVRFCYIDTGMFVMLAGWGPHTSTGSEFFATMSANDALQLSVLFTSNAHQHEDEGCNL